MAARLDGHAVVIEEADTGPVAQALEVHELPAVMLVRDAVIQLAGHDLASMVAELARAAFVVIKVSGNSMTPTYQSGMPCSPSGGGPRARSARATWSPESSRRAIPGQPGTWSSG